MKKGTQGGTANKTGSLLESTVRNTFVQHGFAVRPYSAAPLLLPEDILMTNVPYTSIYGHQGKTEYLASSPARNLLARIECKWQQVAGSVDEKFPYLFENAKNMPEPMVILLIDGGGCKPGALQWLKDSAARYTGKDIRVYNIREFLIWANTSL